MAVNEQGRVRQRVSPGGRGNTVPPHINVFRPTATGGQEPLPLEIAWAQVPAAGRTGDLVRLCITRNAVGLVVADLEGQEELGARRAEPLGRLITTLDPIGSPQLVLTTISEQLLGLDAKETHSATATIAVIEPLANRMSVLNAGNPRPLHLRQGEAEWIQGGGPLLGVLPDVSYCPTVSSLEPGDSVLLVTDGLLDIRDRSGCFLDEAGLLALVQRNHYRSPAGLVRAIFQGAYQFGDRTDDLTVCVVRYLPPARL